MIVTTYTCDKCHHSQEKQATPRQLWEIGIGITVFGSRISSYSRSLCNEQLWCRECIVSVGLLPPTESERKDAPSQPPTLEDLLREMIQEEISSAQP